MLIRCADPGPSQRRAPGGKTRGQVARAALEQGCVAFGSKVFPTECMALAECNDSHCAEEAGKSSGIIHSKSFVHLIHKSFSKRLLLVAFNSLHIWLRWISATP